MRTTRKIAIIGLSAILGGLLTKIYYLRKIRSTGCEHCANALTEFVGSREEEASHV